MQIWPAVAAVGEPEGGFANATEYVQLKLLAHRVAPVAGMVGALAAAPAASHSVVVPVPLLGHVRHGKHLLRRSLLSGHKRHGEEQAAQQDMFAVAYVAERGHRRKWHDHRVGGSRRSSEGVERPGDRRDTVPEKHELHVCCRIGDAPLGLRHGSDGEPELHTSLPTAPLWQ